MDFDLSILKVHKKDFYVVGLGKLINYLKS